MSVRPPLTDSGATFSDDRAFRYRLWRTWDERKPVVTWCLINPSTANENDPDPTLTRCIGFARSWGFGGVVLVNLFAWVSKNRGTLLAGREDRIGPKNDRTIETAACLVAYGPKGSMDAAGRFVVAWGAHEAVTERGASVLQMINDECPDLPLWCLGTNQDGTPKHPLYLAGSTPPVRFRG